MELFIPILFFGALAIQTFYVLFVFLRLAFHKDKEISSTDLPPVSIIIASFNELENLKVLLPLLDQQDYPEFEILIADDRSSDGTYDYLINNPDGLKHLNYLRVLDLPEHYTAKKYAVTLAVKKAKYEWLLFTDADCKPHSDSWIKSMISQTTIEKEIVLGFSKYQYFPGRLNALIRYETFQTALQYLSFALNKTPFMGVGRNLMYKKSLFWKNNGFTSHTKLLSGDDDLFINAAATKHNTTIAIDLDSQTISVPKTTWKEWFVQKRRHLSVGKKYKFFDRLNLGLLWMSGIFAWLLFIPAFFSNPSWFVAPEWSIIPSEVLKPYGIDHYFPYTNWMRLVTFVGFLFLFIKWFVLSKVNKKLGNTIDSSKIVPYDFAYNLYLIIFGIITIFSNPQKIKWK